MEQKYTKEIVKNMPQEFVFFWGHRETNKISSYCLSQWYKVPFEVDGVHYSCAEQYMMAGKARVFGDQETLDKILEADDPKTIKALGRQVRNFDPTIWGRNNFETVVTGNLAKFGQNEELKEYLLGTGDAILVEASPYDKIWGIGMRAGEAARDIDNWKGKNLLGFALMQVRDILREGR